MENLSIVLPNEMEIFLPVGLILFKSEKFASVLSCLSYLFDVVEYINIEPHKQSQTIKQEHLFAEECNDQ
jgi:hypothetical protein